MVGDQELECKYKKEIIDMHKTLLGNGNPDSGVVSRIIKIEVTLIQINEKLNHFLNKKAKKNDQYFKIMLVVFSTLIGVLGTLLLIPFK